MSKCNLQWEAFTSRRDARPSVPLTRQLAPFDNALREKSDTKSIDSRIYIPLDNAPAWLTARAFHGTPRAFCYSTPLGELVDGLHAKGINNLRRPPLPRGLPVNSFRIRKSQREGRLSFPRLCRRRPSSALSAPAFSLPLSCFPFSPRRFSIPRLRIRTGGESSFKMKPFWKKFTVIIRYIPLS